MIVVKPNEITDANLTSTIPEPDASLGEAEWIDPLITDEFGTYVGSYMASALANDDHIYCVGGAGDVLKIDVALQSTSTFGVVAGTYRTAVLATDGNIYCTGSTGVVLKIDVALQTVSTFGAYAATSTSAALANDGNIYCGLNNSTILKINVVGQSVSTFGSYTYAYADLTLANDGNIYGVGGVGDKVLKITVASQTVSEFGSYQGVYFSSSLANDGNIYCVGFAGPVLKINVVTQTVSEFGFYPDIYEASSLSVDGNVYCVGPNGKVLKIDVASQTLSEFGSYTGSYRASSIASDGNIYCVGSPADVLLINRPYLTGERVIKTTTHKLYEAATNTQSDPELDSNSWVVVSATNKYAMYDTSISTSSIDASPIEQIITSPTAITGVAGFGIDGATGVNVTIDAGVFGEVYNKDIAMNDESNVIDAWTYYFSPIIKRDRFVVLDIPPFSNVTATITFTGPSDISIGALIVGPQIELGVANYNTAIELLDFSTQKRNIFGDFEIDKRGTADIVEFDVTIQKNNVSYVRSQLKDLAQVPAVWVGDVDNTDDATLVFGYYEKFRNVISSPTITKSIIKVNGLA